MRRRQVLSWFKGIVPPLVTPFNEQGKIDPAALKAEVEFQISSGARAACVGGSSGEGADLTPDEEFELCSLCVVEQGTQGNRQQPAICRRRSRRSLDTDSHCMAQCGAPNYSGSLSGLMNMFGQLGGWLSPILTAYLATHFGWTHALDFAALVTLGSGGFFMLIDANHSVEGFSAPSEPAG